MPEVSLNSLTSDLSLQEVNMFKLRRMPADGFVDIAGVALFVHYGFPISDSPETAEVLALFDQLDK